MTEVTPHPLKTQGFHHFFILLFYDHPANDVTIMKEGHPEAGTPLFWWVRLELNQRCFRCHGFTDRCDRQLRALTHMAESAELESDITSDTIRLAGGPRAFRVHSPNMAGVAGFEPTVPASKAGALAAWPYPIILEIRAGLEPVIAAVKGLCPNHLDERTVWREAELLAFKRRRRR